MKGGVSVRKAAGAFGLDRWSLQSRLKGYVAMEAKVGPVTVLSEEEGNSVEDVLLYAARHCLTLGRVHLLETVRQLCNDGRPTPWDAEKVPGKAWLSGFLKRNPQMKERATRIYEANRITDEREPRIVEFYKKWAAFLDEHEGTYCTLTRRVNSVSASFPCTPGSPGPKQKTKNPPLAAPPTTTLPRLGCVSPRCIVCVFFCPAGLECVDKINEIIVVKKLPAPSLSCLLHHLSKIDRQISVISPRPAAPIARGLNGTLAQTHRVTTSWCKALQAEARREAGDDESGMALLHAVLDQFLLTHASQRLEGMQENATAAAIKGMRR